MLGPALVLPAWMAALIVGVAVLAIAGIAASWSASRRSARPIRQVPGRTVASVKEDVAEIKESIKQ